MPSNTVHLIILYRTKFGKRALPKTISSILVCHPLVFELIKHLFLLITLYDFVTRFHAHRQIDRKFKMQMDSGDVIMSN